MTPTLRHAARTAAAVCIAPAAATGAYRLALLAAAARPLAPPPQRAPRTRFVVLVPAHDEEAGVGATVAAVLREAYPPELLRVVVVADNCTDATAEVARAAGADVLERDDPDHRGKGAALAWAIPQLLDDADAVVLLDADCAPGPGLLAAFDRRLQGGARVVQADYRVANPSASPQAALRYAGFALQNTIRPAGRSRLGCSAGVSGTGIAFSRAALQAHPWNAFTFAEDREYHLTLVAGGERVDFAPEAAVTSPMPTTAAAARSQEARWESGRGTLLRTRAPALLGAGLHDRRIAAVDAALEPAVPPQSLWAALNVAGFALALVSGRRALVAAGAFGVAAQAVFVLGGLLVAGAPGSVWRALATDAPVFAARRIVRAAGSSGPDEWVRTERAA
ncbi:MAG: glycosyltransferase [Solirubrobacteraceae bacterium]|nr:glycosyltransferase [Solirubrobacteraceae bacterium]